MKIDSILSDGPAGQASCLFSRFFLKWMAFYPDFPERDKTRVMNMAEEHQTPEGDDTILEKVRRTFIGSPRNIKDPSLFHKLALIPILAWIGLGRRRAFVRLLWSRGGVQGLGTPHLPGDFPGPGHRPDRLHHLLRLFPDHRAFSLRRRRLYRRHETLGEKAGRRFGCALLVDYMLTITVSIVSCGDAIFSFFPAGSMNSRFPSRSWRS